MAYSFTKLSGAESLGRGGLAVLGPVLVAGAAALLLSTSVGLAQGASAEEIAKGKEIYEQALGGIPCSACHGEDPTELIAHDLAGTRSGEVHVALATVAGMTGLEVTREEIEAVSAYLQLVGEQQAGAAPVVLTPLAEKGRLLYEPGPGSVGCIDCHGYDVTGLVAPDIHGQDTMQVHAALSEVAGMESIVISIQDMGAIAAYLKETLLK
jgi:mono/diheme cytochrome c family protein